MNEVLVELIKARKDEKDYEKYNLLSEEINRILNYIERNDKS